MTPEPFRPGDRLPLADGSHHILTQRGADTLNRLSEQRERKTLGLRFGESSRG